MILDKELIIWDKQADKIVRNTKNLYVPNFNRYQPMLAVSHVDNNGDTDIMYFELQLEDLFNWRYADTEERYYDTLYRETVNQIKPDDESKYLSWDRKPVKKKPCFWNKKLGGQLTIDLDSLNLTDSRMYEIIYDYDPTKVKTAPLYRLNKPKTLFWDIEVQVDDPRIFPDAKTTPGVVNCISFCHHPNVTTFGNKPLTEQEIFNIERDINKHLHTEGSKVTDTYKFKYVYIENEVELILKFLMEVKKFTAFTGWNTDEYDWPYILNRLIAKSKMVPTKENVDKIINNIFNNMTPLGGVTKSFNRDRDILVPNVRHKLNYDYMKVYRAYDRQIKFKENYSLDYTADRALGIKKVQHSLGFKELYEQDYYSYILYSAVDPIIVEQIDKQLKTADIMYTLGNLTGVEPHLTLRRVLTAEKTLLQYIYPKNLVFPLVFRNEKESTGSTDYEGAFVYNPVPGMYKYMLSFDFASLYPSTIREFNISPDTLIGVDKASRHAYLNSGDVVYDPHKHGTAPEKHQIKTASGAIYTNEYKGILPEMLNFYYNERVKFKDLMKVAKQNAWDIEEEIRKREKQKI